MTYGCYNRPPMDTELEVQSGWVIVEVDRGDGLTVRTKVPNMVLIANTMTLECQYSATSSDPGCAGCKWNRAEQLNQGTA